MQFDSHQTEGVDGFSVLTEYRAPSPSAQSKAREAQLTLSGGLLGMDVTGGLFGMSGMSGGFGWWRSVMFDSPGQSGRPTLQANAVR